MRLLCFVMDYGHKNGCVLTGFKCKKTDNRKGINKTTYRHLTIIF